MSKYELVTMYKFGLTTNPVSWLSSIGAGVVKFVSIPSDVLRLYGITFMVLKALSLNANIDKGTKLMVYLAIIGRMFFYDTTRIILYAMLKLALSFIFIEFNIVKKPISEDVATKYDLSSDEGIREFLKDEMVDAKSEDIDDTSFKA